MLEEIYIYIYINLFGICLKKYIYIYIHIKQQLFCWIGSSLMDREISKYLPSRELPIQKESIEIYIYRHRIYIYTYIFLNMMFFGLLSSSTIYTIFSFKQDTNIAHSFIYPFEVVYEVEGTYSH